MTGGGEVASAGEATGRRPAMVLGARGVVAPRSRSGEREERGRGIGRRWGRAPGAMGTRQSCLDPDPDG